jgi:uncharacterized protein YbdZ (MbtH family)
VGPGSWRGALLVGVIVVAAANDQYVIWRSSAVNGFTWEPASGTYASKNACDEAVEGRKRRIARALAFLRRIGVDDALQHAVGDRIYECRPTLTGPPTEPYRGRETQSP